MDSSIRWTMSQTQIKAKLFKNNLKNPWKSLNIIFSFMDLQSFWPKKLLQDDHSDRGELQDVLEAAQWRQAAMTWHWSAEDNRWRQKQHLSVRFSKQTSTDDRQLPLLGFPAD